jgi:hypothetical protein
MTSWGWISSPMARNRFFRGYTALLGHRPYDSPTNHKPSSSQEVLFRGLGLMLRCSNG